MKNNGLTELGKMSNKDMNELQQYLIAKRANTLADRGVKTGRSRAADEALIKHVGNKITNIDEAQGGIIRKSGDQIRNAHAPRSSLIIS